MKGFFECKYVNLLKEGLLTKEHLVMHMHLNFVFKWDFVCKRALDFSKLAIKPFNSHKVVLSFNCYRDTMYEPIFI